MKEAATRQRFGTCLHCARTLSIYGRGLCRTCYRDPEVCGLYEPLRVRTCRVCNLPWSGRSSWCLDCQQALPGSPSLGARLREPILSQTVELYAARREAGLCIWTGGPR